MKDRKPTRKSAGDSVDEFFRSVYDSLSLKVLAEAVATSPPTEDELEAIEANIQAAKTPVVLPPRAAVPEKKRARS